MELSHARSHFGVSLHVQCVHLVENEGDGVLADDTDMRLEGVDLVRLRLEAVLQAVVL